ncbi:MAG TPA: type II toxin-antitoxin system RelE/ParE family toxin [Allosphingosinicella sp.]|jgi:addiction module RelE/StbE family toxin
MKLVWRAAALDDLQAIISYIADRNPAAAARLNAEIEGCAEVLRNHPLSHRPGRVEGTREAIVQPNYILIYEVGVGLVTITAVVHSRQQYP